MLNGTIDILPLKYKLNTTFSFRSIYLNYNKSNILTIDCSNIGNFDDHTRVLLNQTIPKITCNKCQLFLNNDQIYTYNNILQHLKICDGIDLDQLEITKEELPWKTLSWSENRLKWLIRDNFMVNRNHHGTNNVSMLFRNDSNNPDAFLSFVVSTIEGDALSILMMSTFNKDSLNWNIPIKKLLTEVLVDDNSYTRYERNITPSNLSLAENSFDFNNYKKEIEYLYEMSDHVIGGNTNKLATIASLIHGTTGKLPKDGDDSRMKKKKRVKEMIFHDTYLGDNYCYKILKNSDLFDATYPFSVLAFRGCDMSLIDFLSSAWILYTAQEANTVYGTTDFSHFYAGWISTNLFFEKLKDSLNADKLLWLPQVFSILMRKFVGGRSVELTRELLNAPSAAFLRSRVSGGFGVTCALAFNHPELSDDVESINLIGILVTLSHDLWQEVDDSITGDGLNIAYILRREGFCPIAVWIDAVINGYFPDYVVYLLLGWALGTLASPRYVSGLVSPLVAYSKLESPLISASKLFANVDLTPKKYSGINKCYIHDEYSSEDILVGDKIEASIVRKRIAKYCSNYSKPDNCNCIYNILFDWLKTQTQWESVLPEAKVYRI
ncbi:hypothetical protein K502DRAFT_350645 [Neoconidiobolus thromboides FSU 785]|nr:hypothetical protein K502DRAFT_350645 [Neoconidiobolus thromboides FSU 785]